MYHADTSAARGMFSKGRPNSEANPAFRNHNHVFNTCVCSLSTRNPHSRRDPLLLRHQRLWFALPDVLPAYSHILHSHCRQTHIRRCWELASDCFPQFMAWDMQRDRCERNNAQLLVRIPRRTLPISGAHMSVHVVRYILSEVSLLFSRRDCGTPLRTCDKECDGGQHVTFEMGQLSGGARAASEGLTCRCWGKENGQ